VINVLAAGIDEFGFFLRTLPFLVLASLAGGVFGFRWGYAGFALKRDARKRLDGE